MLFYDANQRMSRDLKLPMTVAVADVADDGSVATAAVADVAGGEY